MMHSKAKSWRRKLALVAFCAIAVASWGCSDDNAKPPPDAGVDLAAQDTAADQTTITEQGADAPLSPVASELVILHTNDLHAHLMGFPATADYTPETTGDDATLGGYARLAARIAAERQAAGTAPLLLLDAGDFSQGTAFSMLGTTLSVELMEMGKMGYDAIAIGNHELDWGPTALAGFVAAAKAQGFAVPLVSTNLTTDASDSGDDAIEALITGGAIVKKVVKTLSSGVKVGILGVVGEDASEVAPLAAPLTFFTPCTKPDGSTNPAPCDRAHIAAQIASAVQELKASDKVDLVVVLSHSGLAADAVSGEDVDLAKAVPGIDVIVSGHTHSALTTPLRVGKTWIVQAGSYGRHLGKLALQIHEDGSTSLKKYDLLPIDDSVQGDTATQTRIDGYVAELDKLLAPAGISYKKVVAETSFDVERKSFEESPMGNLVTDAYLAIAGSLQPTEPPQIAIESPGVLRAGLSQGKTGQILFADIYRALPLGVGPDETPGYPLLTAYLNSKEVKLLAEVAALAGSFGNSDYSLSLGGVKVEYDESKLILSRVTKLTLTDGTPIDGSDTTKCYKVVTNLYIYSVIGLLKSINPALEATPKLSDCSTPVSDPTTRFVDADPGTAGVQELKTYQALLAYLSSFPDTDNDTVPEIPSKYAAPDGRLVKK